MTLREHLEVDFVVEAYPALARVQTACREALANPTAEAAIEAHLAALALLDVIEGWRPLGERERWHDFLAGWGDEGGRSLCRAALLYARYSRAVAEGRRWPLEQFPEVHAATIAIGLLPAPEGPREA